MPEEQIVEVEDADNTEVGESASTTDENSAILRALVTKLGIKDVDDFLDNQVAFKRDGSVLITLPEPEPAPTIKTVTKRAKRPVAQTTTPNKSRSIRLNPEPGVSRNQASAELAERKKSMTPEQRSARLAGVTVQR